MLTLTTRLSMIYSERLRKRYHPDMSTRNMKSAGWMLAASVAVCAPASGQVEVGQKEESPPYYLDAISFASNTSRQSRIDVFIQVPYEVLAFVKKDDAYRAAYEMTIDIL